MTKIYIFTAKVQSTFKNNMTRQISTVHTTNVILNSKVYKTSANYKKVCCAA